MIYTLGMALPFLILALASSFVMQYFNKIKPYMGLLKKIGGAIIILMDLAHAWTIERLVRSIWISISVLNRLKKIF